MECVARSPATKVVVKWSWKKTMATCSALVLPCLLVSVERVDERKCFSPCFHPKNDGQCTHSNQVCSCFTTSSSMEQLFHHHRFAHGTGQEVVWSNHTSQLRNCSQWLSRGWCFTVDVLCSLEVVVGWVRNSKNTPPNDIDRMTGVRGSPPKIEFQNK